MGEKELHRQPLLGPLGLYKSEVYFLHLQIRSIYHISLFEIFFHVIASYVTFQITHIQVHIGRVFSAEILQKRFKMTNNVSFD